jgi:Transposase
MADRISYVGLDVHKDGIIVAIADSGLHGEIREYGRIANMAAALERLVGKLGGAGTTRRFCYEAGPCGYGIQRQLSTHGDECVVVAPSLIPKRAGDRVKTDRRDAVSLARLHRAGELTAVWVPDAGHEAMRDLVRARLDAVHALRRARQQPSGFLLRHGFHYSRPAWTKLHRRWLAGLKFTQTAHHLVLEDYITTVRNRRRATRSADGADRSDAAGLDAGPGGGAAADDARYRAGQCRDLDCRTGRPLALCPSPPADGLSRAGALRAFERRQRQGAAASPKPATAQRAGC